MCKRGDIYYVDFGQNINSNKQCGVRPAVIVSNNRANMHSPVITVVPLTGQVHKKRFLPTHVFVPKCCGLNRDSLALAEQVETIDKNSMREKRGHITDAAVMASITRALQIQIGIIEQYN